VALQADGALRGHKAGVEVAALTARLKNCTVSKQNPNQSFSADCSVARRSQRKKRPEGRFFTMRGTIDQK
jgi:hypothetical protein